MIDIHCHILPGLDDGPKDLEESLRMCELADGDGIKTIVATPHNLNGIHRNGGAEIIEAVGALNAALGERGINISIIPGSDVHMEPGLTAEIEGGDVLTINDNRRFLLLELPTFFIPEQASRMVFELRVKGLTPVISHPERNDTIMKDTDVLRGLINAGALAQITAMSLTGGFGQAPKKTALELLGLNMAHVLASDAHNSDSRPPRLSEALKVIEKELGNEAARKMVEETPALILKGEAPAVGEPERGRKKRSIFSFLGLGGR